MLVLIMAISGRTIPDLFTAATSLLAGFTTATMREDTISMDEALPPRILAMLTSRMDLEVAITVVEVIGKGREIADCGGLHLKYFEVEELYATTPADITTAVRCATRHCAATHSLPAWRGVLAPPSIFKMISVSAWDEPLESLKGKRCCRQVKFYSGDSPLTSRWSCLSRILSEAAEPRCSTPIAISLVV
jgi:hypothetical protein